MEKKELCKKLNQNKKIVIVGPDCSNKNKLRVYNTGGRVARIYVGKRNGKSELMDIEYAKYCKKDANKLKRIIEKATTEEQITNTLLSKDYQELSQDAVDHRYGKKAKKEDDDKERNIETQIMKRFMNAENGWIAIDMEVQCPRKWFENMEYDREIKELVGNKKNKITKQPKFDIITFSKEGIGIIELKVNNENCDNILSHYCHMKHILKNKDSKNKFIEEIETRIDYLIKYGLINKNIIDQYSKQIFSEKKLWCGFLFVGGNKSDSIRIVERLEGKEFINNLKFMYCDNDESKIKILNINNMQNYTEFTK